MLIQECAQLDAEGKPWIQTYSGKPFPIGEPKGSDFSIVDIGHHLSRLNRYTGAIHTEFYTVAEHSVRVAYYLSELVKREFGKECSASDQLWAYRCGLMHDAHEAYLNDLNSPLKRHLTAAGELGYHNLAESYDRTLSFKYKLAQWHGKDGSDLIRDADLSLLDLERPKVMGPPPRPWRDLGISAKVVNPFPPTPTFDTWGWSPNHARYQFWAAAKFCGLRDP